MKKVPTYAKILLGMFVGIVVGLILTNTSNSDIIDNWIAPWGDIFMRLLKMIAIPLVMLSLIKGVGGLSDISKLASIGVKTLSIYIGTTVVAIIVGILLVTLIKPGEMVSAEVSQGLSASYAEGVESRKGALETLSNQSPLQPLVDIFPNNIVEAMGNNGAMLQIILLALLIGVSVVLVGEEKSAPFMRFVESLDTIILKMIDIIMLFAPIGVAALMANLIGDSAGDMSLLSALGLYAFTVVLGLLMLMFLFYPLLVKLFSKVKPSKFVRAMLPVQLMGFSTSSSAATLPTTLRTVENELRVPNDVASFVLPVGVTINMDGTSCYQAIGAIFIAQVMGIDLTFTQIITIILTTTISSIGTPGIPGGSIVISMMVLASVGIPPEGLALILGIDRPLDMLRTSVNVTGDAAVASIVAKERVITNN